MKIASILKIMVLFCILGFSIACNKDCEEANSPICMEAPPTDEDCQAAFLRWFYNSGSKSCEQIGYSGCTQVGFETREDCELCVCK